MKEMISVHWRPASAYDLRADSDSNSAAPPAMRCESHFNPSFGNEKAFNLKEIKINAEPVAAMASWNRLVVRRQTGAIGARGQNREHPKQLLVDILAFKLVLFIINFL